MMKRLICFASIVAVLIILGLLLAGYGAALNAVSATLSSICAEGRVIVKLADRRSMPLLMNDIITNCCYTTSTEFINLLNSEAEAASRELTGDLSRIQPRICASNNIWNVVKNLPANAPNCIIVLATRNIDPQSLRIRLNHEQFDNKIGFVGNKEKGLLRDYAIVIRRDGSALILKRKWGSSWSYATYKDIYNKQMFDLTTNTVNWKQIKYLTCEGEVMPACD